jgi:hypothetical protein
MSQTLIEVFIPRTRFSGKRKSGLSPGFFPGGPKWGELPIDLGPQGGTAYYFLSVVICISISFFKSAEIEVIWTVAASIRRSSWR